MMPFFISGDWPFFFKEQIQSIGWFPDVYRIWVGYGENVAARLWIDYPFRLIVKALFTLGFPWVIIEKLFIVGILILAAWSTYQLSSRYFKESWLRWTSGIVYVLNAYFFLVLGGGQLGVAAAYALFPYAFFRWLRLLDAPSFYKSIATGIIFALLIALDLRFAYLSMFALLLYCLVYLKKTSTSVPHIVSALAVAASLHLYWLFPMVSVGHVSLPVEATGFASLPFFSVADFSHAFSLLHPNWPENLFGRVYFQRAEFLLLPVLAFSSLFFIKKREMLFFPLLALVGIFLAKGVNPPGGGIYEFFFTYIPGFIMFRDPTKFYVLIALSYSMLIPMTIGSFFHSRILGKKMIIGVCVVIGIILFRDVLLGKTTHSFQFRAMTDEYNQLKEMLRADTQFSRVLWLPEISHFAYSDDLHPFINAAQALKVSSVSAIVDELGSTQAPNIMAERNIGYLVVPPDERRQVFLDNYIYDESIRRTLIDNLNQSSFIRDDSFADIAVYRNPKSMDLFSTPTDTFVAWKSTGKNMYSVNISTGARFLIMQLAFDPGWQLSMGNYEVPASSTPDGWVRFELPDGGRQGTVYFAPDRAAKTGTIVSGAFLLLYWFILKRRNLWKHSD